MAVKKNVGTGGTGAKIQAAARARTVKSTPASELEVYQRLLKGNVRGFLQDAWADVMMMVIGGAYLAMVLASWGPKYLRWAMVPNYNFTVNVTTNVTDDFTDEVSEEVEEQTWYHSGPNDVFFFAVCLGIACMFQDLVRELSEFICKKLVVVNKEKRPKFRYWLGQACGASISLWLSWMIAGDEQLGLQSTYAGYPAEHLAMSIYTKIYVLAAAAFYLQRVVAGSMIEGIRWSPKGHSTHCAVKCSLYVAVILVSYYFALTRLLVLMLSLDGFLELLGGVWGMVCLAPPAAKAEKKRLLSDSDGLTYKDVIRYLELACKVAGVTVQMVTLGMAANAVLLGLPRAPERHLSSTAEEAAAVDAAAAMTSTAAQGMYMGLIAVWQLAPLALAGNLEPKADV